MRLSQVLGRSRTPHEYEAIDYTRRGPSNRVFYLDRRSFDRARVSPGYAIPPRRDLS